MFDPNRKKLVQVLNSNKRLDRYGSKKKQKIIGLILQDLDESDIFFRENEFIGEIVNYSVQSHHLTREMIVQQKEVELSSNPEFQSDLKRVKFPVGSRSGKKKTFHGFTLYNRSPLHQAIADKDMVLLEEFAKQQLHFNEVDNNGHTPLQMAMIKGYGEAEDIIRRNMVNP